MNSEQIQDAREMMDIFKQNNFKNLNDESVHQIVAIRKVRELPYFYEISMAYLN